MRVIALVNQLNVGKLNREIYIKPILMNSGLGNVLILILENEN